jgi:hypothetical protein
MKMEKFFTTKKTKEEMVDIMTMNSRRLDILKMIAKNNPYHLVSNI